MASQTAKLPDLGSSDLIAYDSQTEQALGRAFSTALHTQYNLNYDPDVVSYIRKIGHEITSQIGERRSFKFYVIDNLSINAFAGPNGIIGIHTGLILAAKNEDELAAVIAHEIAHVTQNHLSRGYETNSKQSNLTTIATLLAAALIGMYDSSAVYPTLMAGLSLNIEKQLKNSRLHESEADHIGIQFLSKAGYDPHSMGDFFARLAKESQNSARQVPEILRSHPVTERRIVESENRAQTLSVQSPKPPNNELTLIQLKLRALAKMSKAPPLPSQKQTYDITCYQQNLQTLTKQSKQASANIDCLQTLVQHNPNHLFYTTLLLQTVIKHPINDPKKINMARHQATYLLDLYPNNTALLLSYTNLLLYLNQPSEAIALLKTHTEHQRYTYQAYKKLSEIYAKQQQTAEAHFFLALAQFDIGNLKRTQYLLKQAKITADNSLKQRIARFEHKNSNLLKYKEISKH
ncbi:MAG: M48 family metalloprotease [Thiomicrorhabdus sp.]|nr:M48 family metalloprotease [Thiomicrorhabdus sp.]